MVVAGHAGHHGPLIRHSGAAEVYNQVSQAALGRFSDGLLGRGKHSKKTINAMIFSLMSKKREKDNAGSDI